LHYCGYIFSIIINITSYFLMISFNHFNSLLNFSLISLFYLLYFIIFILSSTFFLKPLSFKCKMKHLSLMDLWQVHINLYLNQDLFANLLTLFNILFLLLFLNFVNYFKLKSILFCTSLISILIALIIFSNPYDYPIFNY
jgi:hypothetical protein